MKCNGCQREIPEDADLCIICAKNSGAAPSSQPEPFDPTRLTHPSGFGRTLSTEFLTRQEKADTLHKLQSLVSCRCVPPGEEIIRKGEISRDLYMLTVGLVEVTTREGDDSLVLNEIGPPHVLGDIGCLLGMPRTATIRTKTQSTFYILHYDILKEIMGEFPAWFPPLLSSLTSGIKTMENTLRSQEKEIQRLQARLAEREKKS